MAVPPGQNSKRCDKCGEVSPPEAKFCEGCGSQHVAPKVSEPRAPEPHRSAPTATQTPSRSAEPWARAGLNPNVVVICGVALACALLYFFKPGAEPEAAPVEAVRTLGAQQPGGVAPDAPVAVPAEVAAEVDQSPSGVRATSRPSEGTTRPADPGEVTPPAETETPPENRADKAPRDIIGTWKQYASKDGVATQYLGTFLVSRRDGRYVMDYTEKTDAPNVRDTLGISDITFEGTDWTFSSTWGENDIGYFSLRRVSDVLFVGTVSRNGQITGENLWERVE